MRRLIDLGSKLFDIGAVLLGDVIDDWTSGENRKSLYSRIREAADRGAELALENAKLRDHIDALRFNGPTLWKEEVEFLEECAEQLRHSIQGTAGFGANLKRLGKNLQIVLALIDRCDHMPMTSQELNDQVDDIINGRSQLKDWDDWGNDIDTVDYGHFNPPPGYAICTRQWPHDGPCAHPFLEPNIDDIPF